MAAKGRIDSIADIAAIEKEVTFIHTELKAIIGQFGQYAIAINNVNKELKESQGMAEYNKAIKQGIQLSKEANNAATQLALNTNKLEIAQNRLSVAKNNTAISDLKLAAAKKKATQATIDETKTIEQQIAAAKRQVNSIKEVEAESKKLQQIKKNINTDDKEQAKYIGIINSRLDENTAYLRANGDEATKQRMNIGNYGSALSKVGGIISQVAGALGITAGLAGAFKVAGDVMKSTEQISDKLDYEMSGLSQSVQQLFRNIASGDWSNLLNGMRAAYIEGKRYAEVMDLIGDINRSKNMQNADIELQIIEERTKARDKSLSLAERQIAIDNIVSLGQKKLQNDLSVTNKTLQNELTNAAQITGVGSSIILTYLKDYEALLPSMQKGQKILNDITAKNVTTAQTRNAGTIRIVDQEGINRDIAALSNLEKTYVSFAQVENKLLSDSDKTTDRNKITAAYTANVAALQAEADNRSSLVRMRNGLYKELIAEDEDYAGSVGKAIDNRNQYLLEAQKRYNEAQINLIQDEETREKKRIEAKYAEEIQGYKDKNVLSTELEASLLAEKDKVLTDLTVKYAKDRAKAEQEGLKQAYAEYVAMAKGDAEKRGKYDQLAQIGELSALSTDYNARIQGASPDKVAGLVEEYEQKKAAIVEKYQKASLEYALKVAQDIVDSLPENTEARKNAEKELLDAKIALGKYELQATEEKNKKEVESEKEAADKIKKINEELSAKKWETLSQLFETLGTISNSYYDNQTSKIELQEKKDSEAKEKALKRAGDNEELKESINKKYDALEKKREKEKQEIAIKQAKWEKANALFSIALSTAKAIAKDLVENKALIPFDIAMGALQAAAVLSKPLPKYFKGRSQGKGEFAIVGDSPYSEGATEGIKIGSKMFLTPAKPTLTYLPAEAEVIPNKKLMQMTGLASITKLPVFEGTNSINTKELERKVQELNKGFISVVNAINSRPEYHSNISPEGFEYLVKKGRNVTKYIDKLKF